VKTSTELHKTFNWAAWATGWTCWFRTKFSLTITCCLLFGYVPLSTIYYISLLPQSKLCCLTYFIAGCRVIICCYLVNFSFKNFLCWHTYLCIYVIYAIDAAGLIQIWHQYRFGIYCTPDIIVFSWNYVHLHTLTMKWNNGFNNWNTGLYFLVGFPVVVFFRKISQWMFRVLMHSYKLWASIL